MNMNEQHAKLLARYHDQQTTESENQQVQQLLSGNHVYQQYLDELAQLRNVLQAGSAPMQISAKLANRLADIPRQSQQHIIARLAGMWSIAACILLLCSGFILFQSRQNVNIDSRTWQLESMALQQNAVQYGVDLTNNHNDLQLANLLFTHTRQSEVTP